MCGSHHPHNQSLLHTLCSVQVETPGLQSRYAHSATIFKLSPGLTEVILVGGAPEFKEYIKNYTYISSITVLRFGEFPPCNALPSIHKASHWTREWGEQDGASVRHGVGWEGGGRSMRRDPSPCVLLYLSMDCDCSSCTESRGHGKQQCT